jgi:hypothetical protein
VTDGLEGGKSAVVGVGEPAQVLLGGLDLLVAEAVHHGLEVGATGQQLGGVRAAQVVEAHPLVELRACDGRKPDAGAEDVPRDRRARTGGEEKVVASPAGSHLVLADVLAELVADSDGAVLSLG